MQPPEQIAPDSLDVYLEVMSKAVFQSGMSWKVVEAKWPSTQEAFLGFDVKQVAAFGPFEIEELAQDTMWLAKRSRRTRSLRPSTVSNGVVSEIGLSRLGQPIDGNRRPMYIPGRI
jgi:hypothetical protein